MFFQAKKKKKEKKEQTLLITFTEQNTVHILLELETDMGTNSSTAF